MRLCPLCESFCQNPGEAKPSWALAAQTLLTIRAVSWEEHTGFWVPGFSVLMQMEVTHMHARKSVYKLCPSDVCT